MVQSPYLQTISLFLIYIESPCILRARINSKFRIHRLVPIDYEPSYFISGEFNCHHHHSRATSMPQVLGCNLANLKMLKYGINLNIEIKPI